jgi:hypothetical protein
VGLEREISREISASILADEPAAIARDRRDAKKCGQHASFSFACRRSP